MGTRAPGGDEGKGEGGEGVSMAVATTTAGRDLTGAACRRCHIKERKARALSSAANNLYQPPPSPVTRIWPTWQSGTVTTGGFAIVASAHYVSLW